MERESTTRGGTRRLAWAAIGAVTLLAITGAITYYFFFLRLPVGAGPAGPDVPRSGFDRVWRDGPVLLLGLGDSVTAGFGASPGKSYFDRLVANPPGEFAEMDGICLSAVFPDLSTRNRAVSGSTSIHCLRNQVPTIEKATEDVLGVVVMTTGGNDLIHNYGRTPPREGAMYGATLDQARPWIADFETRINLILDGIAARFPGGCHIFLANIYDPSDGVGDAPTAGLPEWPDGIHILAEYNRIIAACAGARADVHLVDVHGAFLGHGIHCTEPWHEHYHPDDPHYWYYYNIEDPNDRGYDAIRRLFLLAMDQVFHTPAPIPTR